ncbi:hypothetical protein BFP77_01900 [Maribacter sp. 4U21]|uniref:hypothetical protein n=1 Tax=Maribacter sp. 4U21 TaxID=1889779 RepID=UPI000C15E31A|nr:hypothetical protein [Maribacter sp. 4U21]PIB31346.1 hypothetical protein BFP77_01900 [Maribacter sp. 4U21]
MKNQTFLKLTLLVLCFVFSCQQDEILQIEEIQKQTTNVNTTLFTFSSASKDKNNSLSKRIATRYNQDISGNYAKNENGTAFFNWEEIKQTTDSLGNNAYAINFSFAKSKDNEFFNLIIIEDADGKELDSYILRYVCDKEQNEKFIENDMDLSFFKGSIGMHQTEDYFPNGLNAKGGCPIKNDQYGDPVPCNIIHVDTGGNSRSGGNGGSAGGPPSYNAPRGCTLDRFWYECGGTNTNVPHSAAVCKGPRRTGSGWIVQINCGSGEGNNKDQRKTADCKSCYRTSSSGVNTHSRTTQLISRWKSTLGLTNSQAIYLKGKPELVNQIDNYLRKNSSTAQASKYIGWVISIESEKISSNNIHDYEKSLKVMSEGLKKFGGDEGLEFAKFIDGSLTVLDDMTVGEVKTFHSFIKSRVIEFNMQMSISVVKAYVEGIVVPVVEFVLAEVGASIAVRLIQKIPISWVYRGARLNNVIKKVGLMGEMGANNTIRIVRTNAPISTSKELFNSLTKNKIGNLITESNGALKANMGNNNFIIYRPASASQSGFPATITLDLRAAGIWTKVRNVKFVSP